MSVFDRPLDRLLLLLRDQGIPYRCRPQPNRWIARCPVCLEHGLEIIEHGFGGRVSVRCSTCDAEEVLRRLKHPDRCSTCGTSYGQAAELERLAVGALVLAHDQQQLLRSLIADPPAALAA